MSTDGTQRLRIIDDFWRQLSAIDEVLYRRVRKSMRRRRTLRTLAIAVMAFLGLVAVAFAARSIFFGTTAPRTFPLSSPGAAPNAINIRLLSARAADPDGGPPWAMRTFTRRSDTLCVQVGRVVDDRLVVLGTDGAFNNDGRAHQLPIEAPACGAVHDESPFITSPEIHDTSAILAPHHCLEPMLQHEQQLQVEDLEREVARLRRTGSSSQVKRAQRSLKEASQALIHPPPPCDPAALRTIIVGFVGSAGGRVTLNASGRRFTQDVSADDNGAFIFVLNGELNLHRMTFAVRYPNGFTCDATFLFRPVAMPPASVEACYRAAGHTPHLAKRVR